LNALDAANIQDILQSERQSEVVGLQIENAIVELEKIDKWLLHHTYLLEKMGNEVHQIEAQNKGMQVTLQNQRNLVVELEEFIASLKVPGYILDVLENEPLGNADENDECDRAMEKIMNLIRHPNGGKSQNNFRIEFNGCCKRAARIYAISCSKILKSPMHFSEKHHYHASSLNA
jgi:hypothetical protein